MNELRSRRISCAGTCTTVFDVSASFINKSNTTAGYSVFDNFQIEVTIVGHIGVEYGGARACCTVDVYELYTKMPCRVMCRDTFIVGLGMLGAYPCACAFFFSHSYIIAIVWSSFAELEAHTHILCCLLPECGIPGQDLSSATP